ncbi:MAG: PAS domain S-box protein, partial [Alphaproteobacteria bacterium]
METKACPYTYRGKPSVLAVARDISERNLADGALRASESKFRQRAEGSIAGVHIHRNYRTIIANQAYADIFGYTAGELKSLTIAELTHPDDVEESKKLRGAMVAGDSQ